MRVGLGCYRLDLISAGELVKLARMAEDSGFDSIWLAEERGSAAGGGGLAAAAWLSHHTCLAIGVRVQSDLYHPLHLAEDIAVADLCCRGRLEVGLVRGSRAARRRHQVTGSASRWAEQVGLLAEALSGRALGWRSAHYRVPAGLADNQNADSLVQLAPRPAQARVPMWLVSPPRTLLALARRRGMAVMLPWPGGPLPDRRASNTGMNAVMCGPELDFVELGKIRSAGVDYVLINLTDMSQIAERGKLLAAGARTANLPNWVEAEFADASLPTTAATHPWLPGEVV